MSNTAKWTIGVIVVVLVVWGVVASVNKQEVNAGPIKIGFIGPLSGDASNIGQNAQAAVQIAVEEINKAGGIKGRQVEVIYEDGQCNGKQANSAANKLINIDKVTAILGGACSGETAAFTDLAESTETVVLSYCSSAPSITTAGDFIFRDYPSDSYQGALAADYIKTTLGKSKVAVLYVNADWGVGVKDVFENTFKGIGGQIMVSEGVEQTSRDLRSQIAKIKAADPEVIYFLSYTEGSIPGIKQIREAGIQAQLVGGDTWDDAKIWSEVGSAGEGAIYVIPSAPLSDAFKQSMKEKTGGDTITICTPQAYDGMNILARVISKVGTDSQAIQKELYKTNYQGGVSSDLIKFDENGDLISAKYDIKQITGGKPVIIN